MTRTGADPGTAAAERRVVEAIAAAVPEWYGAGSRLLPGIEPDRRRWSVHFPVTVATPAGRVALIAKVPLWDEAPDLAAALAAGPQGSTRAEFEALRRIEQVIGGRPGLTAVRAVGYLPETNTLVTERMDGTPLRARHRGRLPALRSVGSWLRRFHDEIGGTAERQAAGADVTALLRGADPPAAAPPGLASAAAAVRREAAGLEGRTLRLAVLHGDLGPSNVLVDPDGRVAVIDPNLEHGPVEADLAKLAVALQTAPLRLLGGIVGPSRRFEAALVAGYGAVDRDVLRICSRIATVRRWVEVEAGAEGLRRTALPMSRRGLGRAFAAFGPGA